MVFFMIESGIVCVIFVCFVFECLFGKLLWLFVGMLMIEYVYWCVIEVCGIDWVVVLIDDECIYDMVVVFGGDVEMMLVECVNGIECIVWVVCNWSVDVVINV